MAVGDIVATHLGMFDVSGGALITALNAINCGDKLISGGNFIVIPTANGSSVALIKYTTTGW